jgi:hypothetical protein
MKIWFGKIDVRSAWSHPERTGDSINGDLKIPTRLAWTHFPKRELADSLAAEQSQGGNPQ